MKEGPIGIIGAGTMGAGIAQVLAQAGTPAILVDRSPELVEKGIEGVRDQLSRRVVQEKMTQAAMDVVMANMRAGETLQDLKGASGIIEAVFEQPEVKLSAYRDLDGAYGPETLIASNTSGIPITLLATGVRYPERFVGMHFFNPVPAMKLIEVVRGIKTSDETIGDAVALGQSMGKTTVVVKDSPGFVVNRVLIPMINEAALTYSEGIASREDIDTVMKLGLNHPMGPLELADLIGLDICYHEIETLHREFADSKYRPAPLLKQLVTAGHLGRKTGKGFYDYGGK